MSKQTEKSVDSTNDGNDEQPITGADILDRANMSTKAAWFVLNAFVAPAVALTYAVTPKGKKRAIYKVYENLDKYIYMNLGAQAAQQNDSSPPSGGEFVIRGFAPESKPTD